jgi:hypothetical protein
MRALLLSAARTTRLNVVAGSGVLLLGHAGLLPLPELSAFNY